MTELVNDEIEYPTPRLSEGIKSAIIALKELSALPSYGFKKPRC